MLNISTKPIDQITGDDVEQLVREQVQEGSLLEFKERLPNRDGREDPWIGGGSQISERARNELLAEVVAFANAHGGHLVLGIQETIDKPPRAAAIAPLPRCADLADKIRMQARDCIEPQIPVLLSTGVSTNQAGDGVVVVRVEASRLAPHRLKPTLHCYARRSDRTEPMSMREIQDLTLSRERGLRGIDERFAARQEKFRDVCNKVDGFAFGLRVTLLPLSQDVFVTPLFRNERAFPPPTPRVFSRYPWPRQTAGSSMGTHPRATNPTWQQAPRCRRETPRNPRGQR